MKKSAIAFVVIVLFATSLLGQKRVYDWKNLTAEDIAQLREDRDAFYSAKSAGKNDAIRRALLEETLKLDGNQADYDVRYYGINIRLDFGTSTITNRVDYKIKSLVSSLNALDLNLINYAPLVVDSVRFSGTPAAFTHAGNLLMITTPVPYSMNTEFEMSVYYHGTPYFNGSSGMGFRNVSGYLMCYTNCEPFESRYWWPCKDYPQDKPDSVDLYIDYPSTNKVISNGVAVTDVPNGTGRKLVHYKHNYPIATYLIAISCANFVYGTQTWNYNSISMPVVTYTLPNGSAAKSSFDTWMLPVLNKLSDKWGTYPFSTEKAGNAHYGWGGAMEHQTCSFYNPGFYDDWVIAHETGHQWWGDMITCQTFNHIWLNEGFASYSEPIFFEALYGQPTYFAYMQSQKYLGSGTVYVENLQTDDIFDNNLSYNKGSWVLHMLRGVVGDTPFFDAIADYYNSPYKYGGATTENFRDIVSSSVGSDMTWFFTQWIYGGGSPFYNISWECVPDTGDGFRLIYLIQQLQGGTLFQMPIRHTFVTTGGNKDTTIWNNAVGGQVYDMWFPDSVTSVIFDPQEWVLRSVAVVPFGMHIVTLNFPNGYKNVPYSYKAEALGGIPPYYWTHVGGDLPLGLTFDGDTVGVLSGTPNWPATYYFTLQLTDSDVPPNVETHEYAMVISTAPPSTDGDADGSGIVDVNDVVFLIAYIFSGGPAPNPLSRGDADCSGILDISDAVFLIQYIFQGGPAPNCP